MFILDSNKGKPATKGKKLLGKLQLLGIFRWTSLAEMGNNLDTYENYPPFIFLQKYSEGEEHFKNA